MILENKTIANLSFFGVFITLIVISLGAWVRLTDAGLGCPDWPGCYGSLTSPETEKEIYEAQAMFPNSMIDVGKASREMLHRYLAGFLGIYIILVAYLTIKNKKNTSIILPVSIVLLIVLQSLLGMLTVTQLVKPTIVTAHLLLGTITASLIMWNGYIFLNQETKSHTNDKFLISLVVVCTFALLIQIFLGGWTSTNYASLACTDFPKCLSQWWPSDMNFNKAFTLFNLPDINYEGGYLDYNSKLAIHFMHRFGALILSILFLNLFIYIYLFQSNSLYKKIGTFIVVFFIIQVLLGISNIVFSLPITIAVLHTVNASILLMSMTTLLYYSTHSIWR
ncbi:MAG: COX15/CtaA family protein [Pseudomonadota bacterium]|nr:COX15/CtaA family protein [Pseudomonadota bacterium]